MSDKKITFIGPEQFFNIEHPGNPYVEIQFRTSQLSDAKNMNSATWESITLENNFFDQLTITDESGFQNLELILKDRDFINIEDIVLRTVMNSRVEAWTGLMNETNKKTYDAQTSVLDEQAKKINKNNKLTEEEITKINKTILENTFQVYIDNACASCIRIRFGWASGQKGYYDIEDVKNFEDRINQTNPVIRSPWIYFMILGANYNISSEGIMTFLIKGVSVSKAYLETAKLLMNGTVLEDTPKNIWNELNRRISEASNYNTVLGLAKGEEDFFKIQEKTIKLTSLYETPSIYKINGNETRSLNFKSLRQLLTDFTNLLNSKYVDYNGKVIEVAEGAEPDLSSVHHIEKPDFFVREQTNEGDSSIKTPKQTIIEFYYRKPDPTTQPYVRIYSWKDTKNSIIKNLSISTESDFAQMNAPITLKDENGNLKQLNLSSVTANSQGMDLHIDFVARLEKELNNMKGKAGFITSNVFKDSNVNTPENFLSSFIQNLNDNVFKGTLDLPLDPFYLFDNSLRPYSYLIGIDVNTPSRYLKDGTYVSGRKSYLSGYYMIEKIKHTITNSSATTTLDIVKFPEPRKAGESFEQQVYTLEQKKQMFETAQKDLERMDKDVENRQQIIADATDERNKWLAIRKVYEDTKQPVPEYIDKDIQRLNSTISTNAETIETYEKTRPELISQIEALKNTL